MRSLGRFVAALLWMLTSLLALMLATCSASPPRATGPASCVSCHEGEHQAWSQSAHARSSTTPVFAISVETARHPAWCLGCHAPDGAPRGVGCTSCHGDAHGPSRTSASEACARCHEFFQPRLDTGSVVLGPHKAQSTVSEHAASFASSQRLSCAACHMKDGDHKTPSLRGTGLHVEIVEVTDAHVTFALTVKDVGHRVPTGDFFRRLELLVCADAACSEVVGRRVLGKNAVARAEGYLVLDDRRLLPGTAAPTRTTYEGVLVDGRAMHCRVVEKLIDPSLEQRVPPDLREAVLADRPCRS